MIVHLLSLHFDMKFSCFTSRTRQVTEDDIFPCKIVYPSVKIRLGVIQYENVIFCYNEKNNVSQQIFYIGKQTEYEYRYVYNTINTVASVTFYNTTVQYLQLQVPEHISKNLSSLS